MDAEVENASHMAAMNLVDPDDATHVAVKDGDWFDPATWDSGAVPGDDARVIIPDGVSVTYAGASDARIFTIGVSGELRFAHDVDSKLVVDTIVVGMSGHLEIGTEENPVGPDTQIDIVIANNGAIDTTWDVELLSRGIVSMGTAEIHGAAKDSHVKVSVDPMAGDTTLTLAEVPDGWLVGDTIVIAGTENPNFQGIGPNREYMGRTDDVRTIAAIDGNVVTLDEPLEYDHPTPMEELKTSVANYSRSITIRSESGADSEVYERGHVMFMMNDDVDVRYAAFEDLGRTDKSERSVPVGDLEDVAFDSNVQGRYSLHLHEIGVDNLRDAIEIEGNAIWGSPGWGIAQHSTHANLTNNATYDIFGASYVSEAGDEIGRWFDNISIGNEGIYTLERNHEDVAAFDLGRTGNGFWMQSRLIEVDTNIAAGARTGFVWVSQGSPAEIDPLTTDQPDALGLGQLADPRDTVINFARNNEVFGSEKGLTVTKGDPNQGHDLRSVIDGFTAWEVRAGINAEYTSHYTFKNIVLIASEHDDKYAYVYDGIHFGNAVSDMVVDNAYIRGFQYAYDFSSFFPGGQPQSQKQFIVVGGDLDDLREGIFAQDDYLERTEIIALDDIEIRTPTVDVTTNIVGEDGIYPFVVFSGTKTDSLGTIPIPAGTDEYKLSSKDISTIVSRDGYYMRDGAHVFVVGAYYEDRLTGEIVKIGHVVEMADHNVVRKTYFEDPVFMGEFPEDDAPVVAEDDLAFTTPSHAVTINVLANDSDPDGDPMWIDGMIQAPNGEAYDNGDGTLTYVPDADFTGTDTLYYWVTDGHGTFTKASVRIVVNAPEDDGGVDGDGGTGTPDPAYGTMSHDTKSGTGLDDVYYSLAGNDSFYGGKGDDTLMNAAGHDTFEGGSGKDTAMAFSGNNDFSGGGGDDVLLGGTDDDALFGGGGKDVLIGDFATTYFSGNDTLVGGAGDDKLSGRGGADVFAFDTSDGSDTIATFDETTFLAIGADFESGIDTVHVNGFGYASAAQAFADVRNVDGVAVFKHDDFDTTITFHGLTKSDLSITDFDI